MKITFLGTGNSQGIPIIGSNHPVCLSQNPKDKRLRSSIFIEKGNQCFLIDCSPDFRFQMLDNNYEKIDAIFITHEHYDHIGGLEDIRPINVKKKQIIPVYGLKRVLENIRKRCFHLFYETSKEIKTNISQISLHELNFHKKYSFKSEKCIIIYPLFIWHGNLPILGFRLENFAYITDASEIPIQTMKKLKGLDTLVINVLRKKMDNALLHTLHIIQTIHPKRTFLTHISHLLGFHDKIQKQLPNNVYVAYDGLKIIIK
ncbi:MBL fold metallo-hydrolase [Blattabacterium cuenoti]|uniref:MBL fold metallo-hydrolase n=1 Tax=Blattabacterium cuenoti TaxID=1653831 RepID=UPI00163CF342|nr:MBL fold metallo-hydrolase [Blattabacterium cuenoti]